MAYGLDPVSRLPDLLHEQLGVFPPDPLPMPAPAPRGPFGMSGAMADNISSSLLATLQGMGPIDPRTSGGSQFAQAFLRSALGAVATPRVLAAHQRSEDTKRITEANLRATEEYRKQMSEAARDLRKYGWEERKRREADEAAAREKTPDAIRARARASALGEFDAKREAGVPLYTVPKPDGPNGELTWKQITLMGGLGDDVRQDPDIKEFVLRRQGFKQVEAGASGNDAAGDLAMIYGFVRLQDPNAVKEGEFRNVEEAQGKLRQYTNLPRKWREGNRLTPEFRKELLVRARGIYESQLPAYDAAIQMHTRRARAAGIPPELILRDYTAAPPKTGDWFDQNAPGAKK